MRDPLPATATVISFIDRINRADPDDLGLLMTADHRLHVFDEPPLIGRAANVEAWRGYFTSYSQYVIYPRRITSHDQSVAVLGHTTGSHLDLPEHEEAELTLIWLATAVDGMVTLWRLTEDNATHRSRYGLN